MIKACNVILVTPDCKPKLERALGQFTQEFVTLIVSGRVLVILRVCESKNLLYGAKLKRRTVKNVEIWTESPEFELAIERTRKLS